MAARFLGRVGLGQYPTIDDFRFGQEVTFTTDGRPFLYYLSRSWILDGEGNRIRPSATETGYLRPLPDNEVELLLTHPTGFAEIWFGKVTITDIQDARSRAHARSCRPTASCGPQRRRGQCRFAALRAGQRRTAVDLRRHGGGGAADVEPPLRPSDSTDPTGRGMTEAADVRLRAGAIASRRNVSWCSPPSPNCGTRPRNRS